MSLQVAPFDIASRPPDRACACSRTSAARRPSWSRDGKRLAYVVTGFDGVKSIAVRDIGPVEIREIPLPVEYLIEPDWLPDGQSLVVFARDFKGKGGIHRVDVTTGASLADRGLGPVPGQGVARMDGRSTTRSAAPRWDPPRAARLVQHDLATARHGRSGRRRGLRGTCSPDGRMFAAIDAEQRREDVDARARAGRRGRTGSTRGVGWQVFANRQSCWMPDGRRPSRPYGDRSGLWIVPIDGSAPRRLDIDTRDWSTEDGIRLRPVRYAHRLLHRQGRARGLGARERRAALTGSR